MNSLLYFAYGSNMSTPRLLSRTPSSTPVCMAELSCHQLAFHKRSHDGSGKCDIVCTGRLQDTVIGIVFELHPVEKRDLDEVEGLGKGYAEKTVSVTGLDGMIYSALTYYATDIVHGLKPYHWYKEHVVRGAREHSMPVDYISAIESTESTRDPDLQRHASELAIYDSAYHRGAQRDPGGAGFYIGKK